MRMCIRAPVYTYIHTHMHACECTHINMLLRNEGCQNRGRVVHTHTHTHTQTHSHTHSLTHSHTRSLTHTHPHTHTHTHGRFYDPSEYTDLQGDEDLKELFALIQQYKPRDMELLTPLKPSFLLIFLQYLTWTCL